MTQQINLFNPAFLKQKKIFTSTTMLGSLALLLAGALGLVWYGHYKTAELEQRAQTGETELAKKKTIQQQALLEFAPRKKNGELDLAIALSEAELASVQEVITVLQGGSLGNTEGYSSYFTALARQSIGNLWLTGVSIDGAGQQIGVKGRAMEPGLVPAYVSRLKREPVMQGKGFGQLKISRAAATPVPGVAAGNELAPYIEFDLQAALIEPTPPKPQPVVASAASPAGAPSGVASGVSK